MYYRQIVILALINSILAMGAYLSLSTGTLFVCFGTVMSIGAIAAATYYSHLSASLPLAIFFGGIAGAMSGVICCLVCGRAQRFLFAIGTLAFGELTRVLATNTDRFGGALGFRDVQILDPTMYSVVVFAVLWIMFVAFERLPVRNALRVIQNNEMLAKSVGIFVERYRLVAIAAGSFMAGVAGALYIHTVGILDPRQFGFENSIQILAFAIFGGTRSFIGPVIAAVILTIIPEALRFSTSLRMFLYGAMLVLMVSFRPEGILGRRRRQ